MKPPSASRFPAGLRRAGFVDIVTFDTLAGFCGEYLAEGRQV